MKSFTSFRQGNIWYNKRAAIRRHNMPVEGRTQDYLLEECLKILQSQIAIPSFRYDQNVLFSGTLSLVTYLSKKGISISIETYCNFSNK